MPDTCLHLELDGAEVSRTDLPRVLEVQVEEAADAADGASVVARIEAGDDGNWTSVLDRLTDPETPLVLAVSHGEVHYRFDGLSTEAAWQLDAAGSSRLTVKAVDRTLELDREEKTLSWPGSSDSAIAEAIFASHGLASDVEPTPPGPDADVHVTMQRGSDLAFLRSLADKWGYAVYLEADRHVVTGHFRQLDPLAEPQAELSLGFGGDGPAVEAGVQLTAGRRVRAARVPSLSDVATTADSAGDEAPQGARSLAGVGVMLLSPSDVDGEVEPLAAAQALARRSAFAATLTFELDTARAGVMLRARRPVLVKGLGSRLSGRYLVQRVRHTVTPERHVQQVTLVRNALGLTGDEPFRGLSGRLG